MHWCWWKSYWTISEREGKQAMMKSTSHCQRSNRKISKKTVQYERQNKLLAFQLSKWSQSCKSTGEMRLKVYEGKAIRESSAWKMKSSEREKTPIIDIQKSMSARKGNLTRRDQTDNVRQYDVNGVQPNMEMSFTKWKRLKKGRRNTSHRGKETKPKTFSLMQGRKGWEMYGFSTCNWFQRQCWRKGYGSLLQTETEELSTYIEIISKREVIVLEMPVNEGKGKRGQLSR